MAPPTPRKNSSFHKMEKIFSSNPKSKGKDTNKGNDNNKGKDSYKGSPKGKDKTTGKSSHDKRNTLPPDPGLSHSEQLVWSTFSNLSIENLRVLSDQKTSERLGKIEKEKQGAKKVAEAKTQLESLKAQGAMLDKVAELSDGIRNWGIEKAATLSEVQSCLVDTIMPKLVDLLENDKIETADEDSESQDQSQE